MVWAGGILAQSVALTLMIPGIGIAQGEPADDASRSIHTPDGWVLTVTKTAEGVERYPNLAATAFTREGFLSLGGFADISGHGKAPVTAASVAVGIQIACQTDVSNGVTPGIQGSLVPKVQVGADGPQAGADLGITPSILTTIRPGSITNITFGTKSLTNNHGYLGVDQIEVKVDSCMGKVSYRTFAMATISTPNADNSTTAYGPPVEL